jgi:hypothetical protein
LRANARNSSRPERWSAGLGSFRHGLHGGLRRPCRRPGAPGAKFCGCGAAFKANAGCRSGFLPGCRPYGQGGQNSRSGNAHAVRPLRDASRLRGLMRLRRVWLRLPRLRRLQLACRRLGVSLRGLPRLRRGGARPLAAAQAREAVR